MLKARREDLSWRAAGFEKKAAIFEHVGFRVRRTQAHVQGCVWSRADPCMPSSNRMSDSVKKARTSDERSYRLLRRNGRHDARILADACLLAGFRRGQTLHLPPHVVQICK